MLVSLTPLPSPPLPPHQLDTPSYSPPPSILQNSFFKLKERHHYISTNYNYTPLEKIAEKDKVKEEAARAKGLTLIVVPCWWDGTVER